MTGVPSVGVEGPAATPPPARERRMFYGTCALLWAFFALIAYWTPLVLDDWYEAVWIKKHGFSLGSIWDYASYNYVNYNPRIGETFLLLVNGPPLIHQLVTPTIELFFLFVIFALAYGRWPRPTAADTQRMILAMALIWAVVPLVGVIYFYRPFTTNYLFGTCFQLLLFVPYRLELASPVARYRSRWLAPAMLVWGVVAGMTNEHTGPAAMVALAGAVYALWRWRRRLRAWMLTGLVGLWVGYPLLFFAPGQTKRYGGMVAQAGPIGTVLERGVDGITEIVSSFFWEAQLAIFVVVLAALLAAIEARRRGEALRAPDRAMTVTAVVAAAAAGAIVATLFASPLVPSRMYLAPSILLIISALAVIDVLLEYRAARRLVTVFCVGIVGYHSIQSAIVYRGFYADYQARVAVLEATPPGGVAHVAPYARWRSTRFAYGDDFRTFTQRQYVANEYFGLAGIEYSSPVKWGEPKPPFELDYQLQFEPPLTPEARSRITLPTYTSSYVEWVVSKVRRHLPELTSVPGHRFVQVEVAVHGLDLPELAGRRLLWVRWRDGAYTFAESGRIIDERGFPVFLLKKPNIPPGITQTFLHGCGRTIEVPLLPHPKGGKIPFEPWCKGSYVAIACAPDTCWLSGVTWR